MKRVSGANEPRERRERGEAASERASKGVRGTKSPNKVMRPARLERATSWFVVGARANVLDDIIRTETAFSGVTVFPRVCPTRTIYY